MKAIILPNVRSSDSHKSKLKKKSVNIIDQDLNYEQEQSENMFNLLLLKLCKSRKEMASIVTLFYLDN